MKNIENTFPPLLNNSDLNNPDPRYELYSKYNGGVVPILFEGNRHEQPVVGPEGLLYIIAPLVAQETDVNGRVIYGIIEQPQFQWIHPLVKRIGVRLELDLCKHGSIGSESLNQFINNQVYPEMLNDIARLTDASALSAIIGGEADVGVKYQNNNSFNIFSINEIIKNEISELPLTQFIPIDYVHRNHSEEGKSEGLSKLKLSGVFDYFVKDKSCIDEVFLVVPESTLSELSNGVYQVSNKILGIPEVAAKYVKPFTFYGMNIVGLPENHFPAPVNTYHTMTGGKLSMYGTAEAAERSAPTPCIRYGYAFMTNNTSMLWGTSWNKISQQTLDPITRIDEMNNKLEMTLTSEIHFGRISSEGVMVVEINTSNHPLER